jgi:hypothetical protein
MLLGECLPLGTFRALQADAAMPGIEGRANSEKTALEGNKIGIPKFRRREGRLNTTIFD